MWDCDQQPAFRALGEIDSSVEFGIDAIFDGA